MLNYFRDGGFGMWLILLGAVVTFGLAMTRPVQSRPAIFVTGTIFSLIAGMFGMAAGLVAVSKHYRSFPDPVAALGEGLGELANNGTFGAVLALAQGVAALIAANAASKRAG